MSTVSSGPFQNYAPTQWARELILGKCPDALIERIWMDDDGQEFVQFRIPGGTEPVLWRSGMPDQVWLAVADMENWQDYKKSRRVH